MRKSVLIGSNGGLTGVYLAKNLKEMDGLAVFGADTGGISIGKHFVERQFVIPKAESKGFIDALIEILNENAIDYYLPTHSQEIAVISRYEQMIKERSSARFIVSPFETYTALEEKDVCYRNLSGIGIPVPELVTGYGHPFPVFMKKKKGSGGAGSCIIHTEALQRAFEGSGENAFFEYVAGTEYTCDCLFDFKGVLIASHERSRVKTIGGAVSITESSNGSIGLPYILKIAECWKICGCVNFQYIVRDGTPYFTDINLRYPSGGLPLTVEAGIDIPKLVLRLLDGEELTPVKGSRKRLRMYRYFEEIFEEVSC